MGISTYLRVEGKETQATLESGRIALMAARAHERRCAFRAVCAPDRIQGWTTPWSPV